MKLPLVTSYSNLQLRLGYLKIVAALGSRTPTTNEAFERKLAPLFPAPPSRGGALGGSATGRSQSYIDCLFQDLGHERGRLNRNNLNELITLGKAFGFLHPTNCSLFEVTVVLRSIMRASALKSIQDMDPSGGYNPLKLEAPMERAFFLIVALTTDFPIALAANVAAGHASPFRLDQGFPQKGEKLQEGKNAFRTMDKGGHRSIAEGSLVPYSESNILLKSYELVSAKARNQLSIPNWKDWVKYFEGEEHQGAFAPKKYLRMGKRSSFRHHAAPRLEFLVDLGLLRHSSWKRDDLTVGPAEEDSNYCYERNEATLRFAALFRTHCLEQRELNPDKFVRERAMQCFGETFNLSLREAAETERLDFLLQAYRAVKRDIGTTPMWTVAIMASLLALNEGVRLEIVSLYELAREKAKEANAQIRLSGGSRFDGEFLLGIAPELLKTQSPKTR